MAIRRIVLIVGVCALVAGGALAKPSLKDYGGLPSVSAVEISPDGTKIAMVVGAIGERQLQVRAADTRAVLFAGGLGHVKVRGLQWAGEHHLLVITSTTDQPYGLTGPQREYMMGAVLDLDQKHIRPLIEGGDRSLNSIASLPVVITLKGRPTVFVEGVTFPEHIGVITLFKIDLEHTRPQVVEVGAETTRGFLVGPDGEAAARADYVQSTGRWTLKIRDGWGWKPAYSQIALLDPPILVGLGRDGRSAMVQVNDAQGSVMHETDLKDGAWSAPLEALRGKAVIHDPLTHAAIGGATTTLQRTVYTFLAPEDQRAWDAVVRAFPNDELKLSSWSDDRKTVAVTVEGAPHGAAYFIVDLRKGAADYLVNEYAGVEAEDVAPTRVIEYAAADGLKLPAYLTLPADRATKGLPLVVLVHGGPAARDAPGFDWLAQALASRGYAVLQPQYRGSAGITPALTAAGYGQWGRKMQTDLSDGVRALVAKGTVDAKRVCIMGASYGGYAALAGAVFDPAAYRCAVDLAGLSDLRRFLEYERDETNDRDGQLMRYWDRFMGAQSPGDRTLDAISPALHADKAAMPILLIHGKDDTVVPFDQSREMEGALKRAGKPVELVTLKSEDHWLSRGETRLQMLTAAVDFLEKNNPPDGVAAQQASGAPRP
jgi:dienelactone hydrolase